MTNDAKLENVLSHLKRVRRKHDGWTAACPAHEDRNPSLTVGLGRKWIWLNCFAGCEWHAIIDAAGLEPKDLVLEDDAPSLPRRPVSQRQRELTAIECSMRLQNEPEVLRQLRFKRGWSAKGLELLDVGWNGSRLTLPVRDPEGKIHDTLRYDPFLRKGKGRKVLAGKGKSRLPWPAPETLECKSGVLFIVEGEGTAISMFCVGLPAVGLPGTLSASTNVTNPGRWQGSGWHKSWVKRFLRFPEIVLLPDCDGQGRSLMGGVRYDLSNAGLKVSLIDLGHKTHNGMDVADMLLSKAYDGPSRRIAKDILRELVAEEAEVLVAA